MGWTFKGRKYETCKNGRWTVTQADRRKEMDDVYSGESGDLRWTVLKSAVVGTTYYAAVKRENIKTGECKVFAGIALTSTRDTGYGCNFGYKDMDETCGPCCYDCPASILDLLPPTDNEFALEWRRKCRERQHEKKTKPSLSKLPVGSIIEFRIGDKVCRAEKRPPNHQFRRTWWKNYDANTYFPSIHIPKSYTVIA